MPPPPLILLVEDDPDVREVLADVVHDAGFRTEVASNYDDGAVLLNGSRPALLIADVSLPGGGDGRELAKRARRRGVPALLISGYPEDILEGAACGIPFLAKPTRLTELQHVIRTLLEEAPATEAG